MRYSATESFLSVLASTRSTLVVSVYLSDRVLLVSAAGGRASIRSHELARPMGIAVDRGGPRLRLAISSAISTLVFGEAPQLVGEFAMDTNPCGAVFLPRAVYYSGNIDGHDAAWVGGEIRVVNTRFSCIARIGDAYGFEPVWQPPFISALHPEDRCHLNGMACTVSAILYATALGTADRKGGWRDGVVSGGVLIDVATGAAVLKGLCVPHSPRLIEGALFVLESGTGRLLRVDPRQGISHIVTELPGFTRGLDHHGDILFVGLSKLRDNRPFRLPIEDRVEKLVCGVAAVERRSGRLLGWLAFDDCQEIFDVRVLPGVQEVVLEPPNGAASAATIDMPGRAFRETEC